MQQSVILNSTYQRKLTMSVIQKNIKIGESGKPNKLEELGNDNYYENGTGPCEWSIRLPSD